MLLTLGMSEPYLCRLISQLFFEKFFLRLLRLGRRPSFVLAKSGHADEAKAARVGHDCGRGEKRDGVSIPSRFLRLGAIGLSDAIQFKLPRRYHDRMDMISPRSSSAISLRLPIRIFGSETVHVARISRFEKRLRR